MPPTSTTVAPGFLGRLFRPGALGALTLDGSVLVTDAGRRVPLLELEDIPVLEPGLIWADLKLRTRQAPLQLRGLNREAATAFHQALVDSLRDLLASEVNARAGQVNERLRAFEALMTGRYFRASDLERWLRETGDLSRLLRHPLLDRVPTSIDRKALERLDACLRDPESLRQAANERFLTSALERHRHFFDTVEKRPLTDMQRLACVVDEDSNLVLAGAGSGKTSVIVGRAGYLVEAGLARPDEILILAFGNKASQETDERIKERLPGRDGITSRTFHALGLGLIGEATGRKPSVSKLTEDEDAFATRVLDMLSDLSRQNPVYNAKLAFFIAAHLKPYRSEEEFPDRAAYVRHLKTLDTKTLRGERVASMEELALANFFYMNGIDYRYEEPYEIDTTTAHRRQYTPDFYLPDHRIYLEHFAIDEHGRTPPFIDQKSYTDGMSWKRQIHATHGTTLVETYSHQFRSYTVFDVLRQQLEARGVVFRPRDIREVLTAVKDRTGSGNQLTRLIATFLHLFKSSGHGLAEIRKQASGRLDSPRAVAFLDVFEPLLAAYETDLRSRNEVDFNDMINEAVTHLDSGRVTSPYRYILVDEFQDISMARARLLQALIRSRPGSGLFGVGDDWQSIYRFTGSDVTLTSQFERHFGPVRTVALDMTFRFNDRISALATSFVTRNPAQMAKTIRTHTTTDRPAVTVVQHAGEGNASAIDWCLADIARTAAPGSTVYFLGRYGFCRPAGFEELVRRHPGLQLRYDTIHASKGKEADHVVVLDVNDGRLGFPCQIKDDPLLALVLPPEEPYPFAEERRLFYVAVTRSRHHTYVLADASKPSTFVQELLDGQGKTYDFRSELTVGAQQFVAEAVSCPACQDGYLELKSSRFGKSFHGCTQFPYCNHIAPTCERCSRHPMVRTGEVHRCQSRTCTHTASACPACTDGMLLRKTGPYGDFWGCSNFKKGFCTHKRKIET
ncbi:MAG: UvrD-helicase domain-containing protein [bacterium]|nr:UvrD-helicase domain-containing protein [bacterium]